MIALLCAAVALVADDGTQLKAAPRASAAIQARLSRGDWLEIRGEAPGWLKVYDRRRERPGYVRPSEVRVHGDGPDDAPALRQLYERTRRRLLVRLRPPERGYVS